MNTFKAHHFNVDEVEIKFVESWFSNEWYTVYWRWAKPSSLKKIFGCKWHKIYKYNNFKNSDYDSDIQFDPLYYKLDSNLIKVKRYAAKNIHTYQEMADYFGITKSEQRYMKRKYEYDERQLDIKQLQKQLYM